MSIKLWSFLKIDVTTTGFESAKPAFDLEVVALVMHRLKTTNQINLVWQSHGSFLCTKWAEFKDVVVGVGQMNLLQRAV